jgi:hypothetical protein
MSQINATPTFIEHKREWLNEKHGNTIHVFSMSVESEDGKIHEGIFTTTTANQTKFKVGTSCLMKMDTATEDHETVIKFNKVNTGGSGGSGGGSRGGGRYDAVKDRSIMANVSVYVAMKMIIKNNSADVVKNDLKAITIMANKVFEYISEKANKDTQQSITIQAQIKLVAEHLYDFPNVSTDTSVQILEATDKLVEWVNMKTKG